MSKHRILVPLNRSDYSQKIIAHIETFLAPPNNELLLFYIVNPPRGIGFATPDPGSNYALEPGGEPIGPKTYPIYVNQQEESLKAHVAMSTRAQVGVTRFFFRDIAETIAQRAGIPMLLVYPAAA